MSGAKGQSLLQVPRRQRHGRNLPRQPAPWRVRLSSSDYPHGWADARRRRAAAADRAGPPLLFQPMARPSSFSPFLVRLPAAVVPHLPAETTRQSLRRGMITLPRRGAGRRRGGGGSLRRCRFSHGRRRRTCNGGVRRAGGAERKTPRGFWN